jgi:hypothetical protein
VKATQPKVAVKMLRSPLASMAAPARWPVKGARASEMVPTAAAEMRPSLKT